MESIILATEVDLYVDTMKTMDIDTIGSSHWLEWHTRLLKLNQQATLEASEMREEYVKETLVSSGKIPVLVYEAITIYVWKKKVLPFILKFEPDLPNSFTIYSVLFHEATCVALLETVLFHSSSCESLDEVALDLLDYCCEAATQLLCYKYVCPKDTESPPAELCRQQNDMQFDIGIRSVSILRYFAEYLESLPISVTSRMFIKLDVPLLLVELITAKPWVRKTDDDTFKYIGGKWHKLTGVNESTAKLNHTEAQIWIGLRQLLLDPKCLTYYDLTDYRKSQLVKLQIYLQENVLDQLSPLIELKHWLCQLSINNLPTAGKTPVLLEILPQIKENLIAENRNKWKELAREQAKLFFKRNHDELMEIAQSLSEAYSTEVLEKLENMQINACAACSGDAIKKCSRCKIEYYCSRNCQVKHWPQHRETCDINTGKTS